MISLLCSCHYVPLPSACLSALVSSEMRLLPLLIHAWQLISRVSLCLERLSSMSFLPGQLHNNARQCMQEDPSSGHVGACQVALDETRVCRSRRVTQPSSQWRVSLVVRNASCVAFSIYASAPGHAPYQALLVDQPAMLQWMHRSVPPP